MKFVPFRIFENLWSETPKRPLYLRRFTNKAMSEKLKNPNGATKRYSGAVRASLRATLFGVSVRVDTKPCDSILQSKSARRMALLVDLLSCCHIDYDCKSESGLLLVLRPEVITAPIATCNQKMLKPSVADSPMPDRHIGPPCYDVSVLRGSAVSETLKV